MSTAIDRLTALDRLMLDASRRWPQHVGALAILDGKNLVDTAGELRIDHIRAAIASRLYLVPRLRQVVHPARGGSGRVDVHQAGQDAAACTCCLAGDTRTACRAARDANEH